jgi:hypothetical protein
VFGDKLGGRTRVRVVLRERAYARKPEKVEIVGNALVARPLEERVEVGEVSFADP